MRKKRRACRIRGEIDAAIVPADPRRRGSLGLVEKKLAGSRWTSEFQNVGHIDRQAATFLDQPSLQHEARNADLGDREFEHERLENGAERG